jgi:hypothetical protein
MRHKRTSYQSESSMNKSKALNKNNTFREMLKKYIDIKGLDIILLMEDGIEIELHKNRKLINDEIIVVDKLIGERRYKLSKIKSVDLYAA